MKKLIYASVASVLYIAPLIGLYLQIQGGKKLCRELEGIRRAIEDLTNEDRDESRREDLPTNYFDAYGDSVDKLFI